MRGERERSQCGAAGCLSVLGVEQPEKKGIVGVVA